MLRFVSRVLVLSLFLWSVWLSCLSMIKHVGLMRMVGWFLRRFDVNSGFACSATWIWTLKYFFKFCSWIFIFLVCLLYGFSLLGLLLRFWRSINWSTINVNGLLGLFRVIMISVIMLVSQFRSVYWGYLACVFKLLKFIIPILFCSC